MNLGRRRSSVGCVIDPARSWCSLDSLVKQKIFLPQSTFSAVSYSVHTAFVCNCMHQQIVTVHEKSSYKSKTAILDNAHLTVQTLCYFMLKSDLPNRDKIICLRYCHFVFCAWFFSVNTYQFCWNLMFWKKYMRKPGFLMQGHICGHIKDLKHWQPYLCLYTKM